MSRKPKRPKAVQVELIDRESNGKTRQPYAIMDELIAAHHPHLASAKIALAWRKGLKPDVDDRLVLGKCRKSSDLDRELHGYDFVILLNYEKWNAAEFSTAQMTALLDHELCFPGATLVCGPEVHRGFRRWYSGQLVRITTAAGNELAGTPNHPVLTDKGWVPLGLLNHGSHVVCCRDSQRVASAMHPNKYQGPATLEDVFRSGTVSFGPMPESAQNLNPDCLASDVNVVPANRDLLTAFVATLAKHLKAISLGWRNGVEVGLSGFRHLVKSGGSVLTPAPSAVGFSGQGGALGIGHVRHADRERFAEAARLNAGLAQHTSRDALTYTELLFNLTSRCTGLVAADQIVSIERRDFRGHVLNLQTTDNYYMANNVVVHNCHAAVALDENDEEKLDERGRPVWRIRKHNIEEFHEIIERHGLWKGDLEVFAAAALTDKRKPLFSKEVLAAAKKLKDVGATLVTSDSAADARTLADLKLDKALTAKLAESFDSPAAVIEWIAKGNDLAGLGLDPGAVKAITRALYAPKSDAA